MPNDESMYLAVAEVAEAPENESIVYSHEAEVGDAPENEPKVVFNCSRDRGGARE